MMTSDMLSKLMRSLIKHEGYRRLPYLDTKGYITLGIGYNLSARGLDDNWINTTCKNDVRDNYNALIEHFPWFLKLSADRQIILLDMSFMGIRRLLEFEEMLKALEIGDFEKAADEMLNSIWATEVKGRATDLANAMRTGKYEI